MLGEVGLWSYKNGQGTHTIDVRPTPRIRATSYLPYLQSPVSSRRATLHCTALLAASWAGNRCPGIHQIGNLGLRSLDDG